MSIWLYPMTRTRKERIVRKNLLSSLSSSTTVHAMLKTDLAVTYFNFIPIEYFIDVINNPVKERHDKIVWKDDYRSIKKYTYGSSDVFGILFSFVVNGQCQLTCISRDFPVIFNNNFTKIGNFTEEAVKRTVLMIRTFISILSLEIDLPEQCLFMNIFPVSCESVPSYTRLEFFIKLPIQLYFDFRRDPRSIDDYPFDVLRLDSPVLNDKFVQSAIDNFKKLFPLIEFDDSNFAYHFQKGSNEVTVADLDTDLIMQFTFDTLLKNTIMEHYITSLMTSFEQCGTHLTENGAYCIFKGVIPIKYLLGLSEVLIQ